MNGPEKLYVFFWSATTVILLGFFSLLYAVQWNEARVLQNLIDKGHSPLVAACAMATLDAADSPACEELIRGR